MSCDPLMLTQKEIARICQSHGIYVLNGMLASRMYTWGTLAKPIADTIAQFYGFSDSEGLVHVLTKHNGAESLVMGGGHAWFTQYDIHCVLCYKKLKKGKPYPAGPWRAVYVPVDGKRCPMCGRVYRPRRAYTKKKK